mmetsp:Transcript_8808/g.31775  ORF Transcript_8808/g.31775 Transcript_8808/m.31775 type:complete len:209 (+) Transcript_8808:652-1278(+)
MTSEPPLAIFQSQGRPIRFIPVWKASPLDRSAPSVVSILYTSLALFFFASIQSLEAVGRGGRREGVVGMGGIGRVSKRGAQRSRFVGWTVGATVEEGVGRGSSLSERPRGKRPRESVWGFGVTVPEEEHCLQSAGLHCAFRHAPRRHARVEKNAGLLGPLGRRSGGRDPPNWRPLRRARGLVRLARQTPVRQTGTRCWKGEGSQDRTP